jgi:hypothetical protein
LEKAENFTGVAFDFSFANKTDSKPPVGRFPSTRTMYAHIQAKYKRNWTYRQAP